jgi:hypothetical protein
MTHRINKFVKLVKKTSSLDRLGRLMVIVSDDLEQCSTDLRTDIDDIINEQANKIVGKTNKKIVGVIV